MHLPDAGAGDGGLIKLLEQVLGGPSVELLADALLDDTEVLLATCRKQSQPQLRKLMNISEALGTLNWQRFQDFELPLTPANSKPAALTFAGDVYFGLDAKTMSDDDLHYAQSRVAILSGLFGVLRPLDLMQPYRLEMGTGLATGRGKGLYRFWGKRISAAINELTADHADRTIVNLASNEYFKSVAAAELASAVITPVFKEERDNGLKMISQVAKRSRGAMARWLVDQRSEQPEDIKAFDVGGYRFRDDLSDNQRLVFTRKWVPGLLAAEFQARKQRDAAMATARAV